MLAAVSLESLGAARNYRVDVVAVTVATVPTACVQVLLNGHRFSPLTLRLFTALMVSVAAVSLRALLLLPPLWPWQAGQMSGR